MSARLVVRKVKNGETISSHLTEDMRKTIKHFQHTSVEALLMYRTGDGKSPPWHSYGKAYQDFSVDDCHSYLNTKAPVIVEAMSFMDVEGNTFEVDDKRIAYWYIDLDNDGIPEAHQLGIVGLDTKTLSNKKFFESFRKWEDLGYRMDTAGYLAGGSKVFGTIDLNVNFNDFVVREGDAIRPNFFAAHSHDNSLSLTGGLSWTRIVCNNTLSVALSSANNNEEKNIVKFKHVGDLDWKTSQIHEIANKIIEKTKLQVEKYRELNSKKITEANVNQFVNLIQGKTIDSDKIGPVHKSVWEKFEKGIAIEKIGSATFWDLLNSWTELVTHDLGNEQVSESAGDRVARRLESAWFGTGNQTNNKAFDVAMKLMKNS